MAWSGCTLRSAVPCATNKGFLRAMCVVQRRRRQIAILIAHGAAEISFRKRRVVVEPVHNRRDGKPRFETAAEDATSHSRSASRRNPFPRCRSERGQHKEGSEGIADHRFGPAFPDQRAYSESVLQKCDHARPCRGCRRQRQHIHVERAVVATSKISPSQASRTACSPGPPAT